MKKTVFFVVGLLLLLLVAVAGICTGNEISATDAESAFKRDFPQVKYTSVSKTDIAGLFKVEAGSNAVYYHPATGELFMGKIFAPSENKTVVEGVNEIIAEENVLYYHKPSGSILIGEFINKKGESITAVRRDQLAAEKIKGLPLQKAIKIGNGKNIVIEFTDIDCAFCRKAEEFFKNRDDVTRYVFLFPLPQIHPKSAAKSQEILCKKKKDIAKAYTDAMSGSMDNREPVPCNDQKVKETLVEFLNIGAKMGVLGTPMFWINGQQVKGADVNKMNMLLSGAKSQKEGR